MVRAHPDEVPPWAEGWTVLSQGSAVESLAHRPSADDPVMLMDTPGTRGPSGPSIISCGWP